LISFQIIFTSNAEAFSWKHDLVYGVMTGFGGSGLDEDQPNPTNPTDIITVKRSEDPGMLGISVEAFLNDKWSLALTHRRGYKLGPFSTKVGFTGVVARRYFGRAPFIPSKQLENSAVLMRRWAPFVGLGGGIARGSITRAGDAVPRASGSGVYMGIHLGADYHLRPNLILRPEFFTSGTFMDDSTTPATLKEYGLVVGFHFRL
jgi:hypothetical protein